MGYQARFDVVLQKFEGAFFRDLLKAKNKVLRNAILSFESVGVITTMQMRYDHYVEIRRILIKHFARIVKGSSKWQLKQLLGLKGTIAALEQKQLTAEAVEISADLFTLWATEYFKRVGVPVIKYVTDTVLKDLESFFIEAQANNLTTPEIITGIRGLSGLNASRARTIARTETHGAAIEGAIKTAEYTSAKLGVTYKKIWHNVEDARVREAHANMNAYPPIDPNDFFIVGGEKMFAPGDKRASLANFINCRCALSYINVEDLDDDDDLDEYNPYL